jgi:peptide/nickel transport system substrate-binding protein
MKDDLAKLVEAIDAGRISRRSFLNRTAAFGLTAALGTSLLPTGARADDPKQGGILKMGISNGESTDTMDPGLANSNYTFALNRQWGDTIVNVSPTGEIEMVLAETMAVNEDGSVWTFGIRQGVTFHNGSALTAEDVAATFRRHSDDNAKSGAQGIMKGITTIAVDGNNVVLTLTGGNADLPYLLSDYHLVIQPGGGIDAPTAGVGTGPYTLTSFEPGVRAVFAKNAGDWNKARAYYDGVELIAINDATARNAALQAGEIHIANRVDPKTAKLLAKAPGVVVTNAPGRGHYVFIMHCDVAPFDNNDLRLALKYAINREEMVEKILDGYGSVGNDTPINKAYPLFDEALPQRPFDLAKAAEHYKASGHDGSPIVMQVAEGAFPGAVDAAALFQQTANAAGIPLEIKREPDDGYWDTIWNVAPFCASYWGGRPVQDQMWSTAYQSKADWNDTRFKNTEFDDLLLSARGETDLAKRKEIYAKMATMVNETGGTICPMFNDFVDAYSDTLAGWVVDPNYEASGGFASSRTWFA